MARLVTIIHTLNGSWQQLSATDVLKCERISFQAGSANGGIVGIADSVIAALNGAATTAGEILPIPVDALPPAPIVYESSKMWYQLNQFWVKGTDADVLRINVITTP